MMKPPDLGGLAKRWHRAPRRWGHPLHSLCSYFAMFPPQVPHVFIRWLTKPGDVVYDPFAGRGTAPMEACRMGRVGMGSDANPLAHLLTASKVNAPTTSEAQARLNILRHLCVPKNPSSAPADIQMLYSDRVLGQLIWLRETLNLNRRDDCFIMAMILGVLHAHYKPGRPARGFSISMPNTFSMSANYVRGYIAEHRLTPPDLDVFDLLDRRLGRLYLPEAEATRGIAWKQDARKPASETIRDHPAKLVFTSPPYLSVIKYGKYNWIRLWMLKQEPNAVDQTLVTTASLAKYLKFIEAVLEHLTTTIREDGYLCLMIGDIIERATGRTTKLALQVWEEVARPHGWHLCGTVADRIPANRKVSRIWKHKRGEAIKTDRILILSPTRHEGVQLPALAPIRWEPALKWETLG